MKKSNAVGSGIFFANLDGLRFFAFLGVFVYHCFHTTNPALKNTAPFQVAMFFKASGFLGVNFFFVLSGFLITYLLLHEREEQRGINIRNFYVRRILRIWPLYYACILFGFLVFPQLQALVGILETETASPVMFVAFLANFDALVHMAKSSVLGKLWSISVEEQFYLAWPLLIAFVPRRQTVNIFVVLLLTTLGCRIYYSLYSIDSHVAHQQLYFNTFCVIGDMAIGGWVAYASYFHQGFRQWFEKMPAWQICMVYAVGLLLIVFRKQWVVSAWLQIGERFVFAAFFAFVIAEQNLCRFSFYKMQNFPLLSKLGGYTYGMYCLHAIGLLVAFFSLNKLHLPQSNFRILLIDPLLALAVTIAISWFSYRFFETPFLQLKKRFSSSRSS